MAELELHYDCISENLDTPDGEMIQVFWLPAAKRFEKKYGNEFRVYPANTMILCNPNMGFAEV